MSVGSNIKRLREGGGFGKGKMTQEELAEKMGVSFQAISSWERDEYYPDTENLIKLVRLFDVSLDAVIDDRKAAFITKKELFDWEHMKTYVKTTAAALGLKDTLKALDYASEIYKKSGQKRNNSEVTYFYHPLNMACHALSMGINEDAILAAIILHDVIEDTKTPLADLPVGKEAKDLIRLLTKPEAAKDKKTERDDRYYEALKVNPKAALIKCIDRCNNLTTMTWGMDRDKRYGYIFEAEKYYPELLKAVKAVPEYGKAHWLLKYQIESMLDIYKRLL